MKLQQRCHFWQHLRSRRHLDFVLTITLSTGGLEIYSSTFDNLAVGKDFPLITLTVGKHVAANHVPSHCRVTLLEQKCMCH